MGVASPPVSSSVSLLMSLYDGGEGGGAPAVRGQLVAGVGATVAAAFLLFRHLVQARRMMELRRTERARTSNWTKAKLMTTSLETGGQSAP